MKTPIEFEYYLWRTSEGKYMVRIKRTCEECEVDPKTFRLLRKEEKQLRRLYKSNGSDENKILHLDSLANDETALSTWLIDENDFVQEFLFNADLEKFKALLTNVQKDVFVSCFLERETYAEYARRNGIKSQSVQETVRYIKIKAKKFFDNI